VTSQRELEQLCSWHGWRCWTEERKVDSDDACPGDSLSTRPASRRAAIIVTCVLRRLDRLGLDRHPSTRPMRIFPTPAARAGACDACRALVGTAIILPTGIQDVRCDDVPGHRRTHAEQLSIGAVCCRTEDRCGSFCRPTWRRSEGEFATICSTSARFLAALLAPKAQYFRAHPGT
jgi:hypothetical protein